MAVIWELDFYSRPVLNQNKKKIWELLICDRTRQMEWVQECPSDRVNSAWLAEQLQTVIQKTGQTPQKVRFFRPSMANIITRGCNQAGLNPLASRRVFTLAAWLQERMAQVYPQQEGFQAADPNPLPLAVPMQQISTRPIPDALIGEGWAIVSLRADQFASAGDWSIDFEELFDLSYLSDDTLIPGLIIYSHRATPLAAWMAGVDPVFLKFVTNQNDGSSQMLLEANADARWLVANFQSAKAPKNAKAIADGQAFETAKQKAAQVHFLAIQDNPDSEDFAGFWLLKEV
ncbi:protein of unknown function DUF1092 [Thalassoporum mexicanum PCC 7367]|uniref:Tab2/Atab2 family RNA-binding protein n=1 Tax=Thalassoporum mexicanum TaxID=3457544 RepID=UPI00029F9277|nr:Tab2/Atab2 family RNA-binding protein [Pseudanabaena sp. PCC 7367]AFY70667.1 protein of unknown function DUF1092 [Pseudanabaena sp. PCC 7367]